MSKETTTKVPCPGWTEDSNAFAIMGRVRRCLKVAGVSREAIDRYTADATSGDYDHLLQVTMTVVEDDPYMALRERFDEEFDALHEAEGDA